MGYRARPELIRTVARFFLVLSDWLNSENCGSGRCIQDSNSMYSNGAYCR